MRKNRHHQTTQQAIRAVMQLANAGTNAQQRQQATRDLFETRKGQAALLALERKCGLCIVPTNMVAP